jgi:hypothetical protein
MIWRRERELAQTDRWTWRGWKVMQMGWGERSSVGPSSWWKQKEIRAIRRPDFPWGGGEREREREREREKRNHLSPSEKQTGELSGEIAH